MRCVYFSLLFTFLSNAKFTPHTNQADLDIQTPLHEIIPISCDSPHRSLIKEISDRNINGSLTAYNNYREEVFDFDSVNIFTEEAETRFDEII